MHLQLLTLVPAAAVIAWAVYVQFKDRHFYEGITQLVCAAALLVNGAVVSAIIHHGYCPSALHFAQLLLSSSIVPLAYVYFARQMGRRWNNTTAIACWAMILLILAPNINIILGDAGTMDTGIIRRFTVNIIRDGRIVASWHTADLVILIQAFFTVGRIIPAAKTLRKYGLSISTKMKGFFLWWISAVFFIIFTSSISTEDISTPLGSWAYYILYSLLICSIFTMLALRFDLHPVVTKEEGEVVKVDEVIEVTKNLADKMKRLLEEDKVYLQQSYTAEDAVNALGTNRTYFARMMTAEFGMKFSDIINDFRIRHAQNLLLTTELSISDVADQSGFSDPSYMTRKFHQVLGLTPTAYRHNNQ